MRESYFQGIGYNRLDHDGTLFMFTRSIENREDLQEEMGYTPVVNPDAVQLIYKYFVLKYQPIARGKGKVTMAVNGDMRISVIPTFLLNIIAVRFGNDFFAIIMDVCRNLSGSKWEAYVKQDPGIHDFFKNAIDQHLTKKGL